MENNPVRAKMMGKKEKLPDDWDVRSVEIMEDLIRDKFSNPILADALRKTGDAVIVEGNRWHDNKWGKCSCDRCRDKESLNLMGNLLMKIRNELNVVAAGEGFYTGPFKFDNALSTVQGYHVSEFDEVEIDSDDLCKLSASGGYVAYKGRTVTIYISNKINTEENIRLVKRCFNLRGRTRLIDKIEIVAFDGTEEKTGNEKEG